MSDAIPVIPDVARERLLAATAVADKNTVALAYGFTDGAQFATFLDELERPDSVVSQFELAIDAIVSGDEVTLEALLTHRPELIRERSMREHRSTLLHYVSANGVEDFRQKTPTNIVAITRRLLEAGADVAAESEAYGGKSTALGLTATSFHPQQAGVQIELMKMLIEAGAVIDGPDGGSAVIGCLRNGRRDAAEFFAEHGAKLDLEAAAGVGRLDIVAGYFDESGKLKPSATEKQKVDAFAWACEFGRTEVVRYLLNTGLDVQTTLPHHGQIGLHWAALGGHAETCGVLLDAGSAVDSRDAAFGGTPLHWALYGWGNSQEVDPVGNYYVVVAKLVGAGAKLDPSWFVEDDSERQRTVARLKSDERMQAALNQVE